MHKLEQLAEFLETKVSESQFDLSFLRQPAACGTVCCAMGWAVSLWPEELMFFYEFDHGYDIEWTDHPINIIKTRNWVKVARDFFEITEEEVFELFLSRSYKKKPSIADVTERLRKVAKRYEQVETACGVFEDAFTVTV